MQEKPNPSDLALSVLDSAPFGLEISADDGRILYANKVVDTFRSGETPDGAGPQMHVEAFSIALANGLYSIKLALDESKRDATEQELMRKAYFDELTGLPNKVVLESSIAALIAEGASSFALAVIDLDGLKDISGKYGSSVEEALFSKLAGRLEAEVRNTDLLACVGSDRLALLVSPVGDRAEIDEHLHRAAQRLREPCIVDGNEFFMSTSIGVSIYPGDGRDFRVLRSNAERALSHGRATPVASGVTYFEPAIQQAVENRSTLEQRLRLALRDKRIRCAYQPKVDLRSGEVIGVEALMRWIDEDGGVRTPGEILPLANELGLIDNLTEAVMDQTLGSIDRINEAFGRDCSISLNVAAKQAANMAFMSKLTAYIHESGLGERFIVEVTEDALLNKADFQESILPMIRAIGARVSIDDFGTGYSSLSALADITADELKIDRSFITDVHRRSRSQSVLKAIEALGHSLGMSLVAEGVETLEELTYLRTATRIQFCQGHYFSKPILLDESGSETAIFQEPRQVAPARTIGSGRS